jgi:hypothetical protein
MLDGDALRHASLVFMLKALIGVEVKPCKVH